MTENLLKIDWGGFALIEYLLSKKKFKKKFKALDIGGALGNHTKIMRDFGLKVDSIDKYEKDAEFVEDFNTFKLESKYDMIHCSHVIEHQRNQGAFLDKIYDVLKDDGDLIISGPKHPAERFVEGHIATTIMPIFLQILIYSGFDCKNGKILSLGGIENSFIVKKAKNFNLNERYETGYKWKQIHNERSPIHLTAGYSVPAINLEMYNCEIFKVHIKNSDSNQPVLGLVFDPPKERKERSIQFLLNLWKNFTLFDTAFNEFKPKITDKSSKNQYVLFQI